MINSGILDFPRLVRVGALQLEKSLEAAIDHALAVERHVRHFGFEPRIRHHFGVDLVALRARLADRSLYT